MSIISRREFMKAAAATSVALYAAGNNADAVAAESAGVRQYRSQWHRMPDRYWTGPATWANPWEDWQIQRGKLVCTKKGNGNRTVHCLTHQLNDRIDRAQIAVIVQYCGARAADETGKGLVEKIGKNKGGKVLGSAGFAIGVRVKDPLDDYRSRLLFGSGMNVGITGDGELFIGAKNRQKSPALTEALASGAPVRLVCTISPESGGKTFKIELHAGTDDRRTLGVVTATGVAADRLVGNVAIANNISQKAGGSASQGLYAFSDWTISGAKITARPDQSFGPILWTLYTLSNRTMKMTAQMPPIGEADDDIVTLQVRSAGRWKSIATAPIDPLACTATFRVTDWDDTKNTEYRVCWKQKYTDGGSEQFTWSGKIRKDPVEKPEITVAGYCCFMDYLFPNVDIARETLKADPDIMFFTGDQIYEGVGGFGIIRSGDIKRMVVNYIRKVALVGWSFREVTKDRPTVWMPDDHDVYHGNLWGADGRRITLEEWSSRTDYQGAACVGAMGGYVQPADFVIAVEKTQTAHLPDPYDPRPIDQGIGVYYTALNYGRVSFAILEDRKFKSGPLSTFKHRSHRPDWITDRKAALESDAPGAKLLGQRQLQFLQNWIADWHGVDMKMAISQTVLCNAATHHGGADHFLVADMDSNGWPQSGRNRALDIIRRGYALMLGGDQHLPTIVQHGIEKHHDAGFSFCVPAGATGYQRWWRPEEIDAMVRDGDRHDGRAHTGKYRDGFGNLIDLWAAANPPARRTAKTRLETGRQKSAGFGIVRVNRTKGTFTMEAWPVGSDTKKRRDPDMYGGWPMTIDIAECAGAINPTLPPVVLRNWKQGTLPVVQVSDAAGKIVSVTRMPAPKFSPRVFDQTGKYTVTVYRPEAAGVSREVLATFRDVAPGDSAELVVK